MTRETVDADAWVAARGPDLLRLAFALTGDAGGAEAVVVEALSRALPRWSRLSRTGDPEEPLRRMVVAAHRSHARRLGRPAAGVGHDRAAPGEERARLRAACRALPSAERAALVLVCVEDLPLARAGDLAGTREGVVRARLQRALAAVRTDLGEDGAPDDGLVARLREALAPGDDELPPAPGLLERARGRLAERRRRAVGLAAAALVAVAVPAAVVGLLAATGGDADGPRRGPTPGVPTSPAPPPPTATGPEQPEAGPDPRPEGFRWETWHRLQVAVPDEWGYSSPRSCDPSSRADAPAFVERPGGREPGLGCGPSSGGYGVRFSDASAFDARPRPGDAEGRVDADDASRFPVGSWVGYRQRGFDAVRVVARSRAELRAILGSLRAVAFQDVHGCSVATAQTAPSTGEGVSVCRYDGQGLLAQAERLDGSRALGALAALDEAPVLEQPSCGASSAAARSDGRVLLRYGSTRVVIDLTGPDCRHGAREVGGPRRRLTPELLYWALSPGWSGPAAAGVPVPDPLRSRLDRPPAP